MQGVWCDEIGELAQVTPVSTLTLEAKSVSVQAETSAGLVSFEMARVSP